MKRRILSACLALALCVGLAIPALAAETTVYLEGFWEEEDSSFGVRVCTEEDAYLKLESGGLEQAGTFMRKSDEGDGTPNESSSYPVYTSSTPVTVTLVGGGMTEELYASYLEYREECISKGYEAVPDDWEGWTSILRVDSVTYDKASRTIQTVQEGIMEFEGTVYYHPDYSAGHETATIAEYNSIQEENLVFGVIENGASVTLSQPGTYCIFEFGLMCVGSPSVVITITGGTGGGTSSSGGGSGSSGGAAATPTASTVLVDGLPLAFDAYNIGGNNYFKLRDLAYVLNGSAKQFEVSWDASANAIRLTSGQGYTVVGGEMAAKGAGSQSAKATASRILLDGEEVSLTAYNIGGNNYFKLRDIGEVFDFGVGWDSASKTITIDTSTGYTAG